MYDLIFYKYMCEDGSDAITLVYRDESGLILKDAPVACMRDSVHVALANLKELTKTVPLEERLWLFFKLLSIMNYEATYTELYHLLVYFLS